MKKAIRNIHAPPFQAKSQAEGVKVSGILTTKNVPSLPGHKAGSLECISNHIDRLLVGNFVYVDVKSVEKCIILLNDQADKVE